MTREEWDQVWLATYDRFYNAGHSHERSRVMANDLISHQYGPRPASGPGVEPAPMAPKLPFFERIALSLVLGRIKKALEGNPMGQRIVTSIVFGLGAAYAVVQASGWPHDVNGWVAVAGAFVVAFWGKFSSSRTIVAANYTEPTPPAK